MDTARSVRKGYLRARDFFNLVSFPVPFFSQPFFRLISSSRVFSLCVFAVFMLLALPGRSQSTTADITAQSPTIPAPSFRRQQ